MRSIYIFVAVMALFAVALSVSAQPPPRHESIIILFNDSMCTQHVRTDRVMEPSSNKCEVETGPRGNFSNIFQCDTANNVTKLVQQFYNGTVSCDNTPIIAMVSSAPAHTCAPVSVTFEGTKAMLYGFVDCAPENMTSSYDDMMALRQTFAGAVQREQEQATTKESFRSFFARIFNL